MISILKGSIESVGGDDKSLYIDLMTTMGIGYRVFLPSRYSMSKGKEALLYTAHIVREDSQTLFGFEAKIERRVFELLRSVSGIGPKIALAILSTYSVDEINSLIIAGDHGTLSKVSGLGKKGAQKIILDLQDKITDLGLEVVGDVKKKFDDGMVKELKEALKSLGFSGEALDGYVEVAKEILVKKEDIGLEELIKLVLSRND